MFIGPVYCTLFSIFL